MSEKPDAPRPDRPVRTIVLRRFEGESLEVVALDLPPPVASFEGPRGCRIRSRSAGDAHVYEVELPEGYAVRPVDWRRFRDDSGKVRALIETCVRDNTVEAQFEVWTEAFRAAVRARLALALADLASLIEEIAVEVSPEPEAGRLLVHVGFADWHRRRHQLVMAVADAV